MRDDWSTLKKLIWLHAVLGGGGGGTITTVTGLSPLALVNALAKPIKSLIQYGKVTTVDGEMFCNNGKLVAVHRSGLPSGYKLLEYVGSSGAAYVLTDIYLASTDVVEAEFRNSSTTGYGALYGVFRLGDSSALYANQTYYGYDESNNKADTDLRVNTDWHSSRHDFVNGTLTIDDTTVTFPPFEFVNSVQNAVLSRYYNNNYGYVWKGFVRKFKVTRGGEVICDLLPAKNEQDVAGLYDLISGTFYTATGGDLLEGNEVDDYELRVVGTPEVLTVGGQNLADLTAVTDGYYYDPNGVYSAAPSARMTDYIPVRAGITYTVATTGVQGSSNVRYNLFDSQQNWLSQSVDVASAGVTLTKSIAPAQNGFLQVSANYTGNSYIDWSVFQIVQGAYTSETMPSYQPYVTPQTVTNIPMLLSVGDIKDALELISGVVTRRTEVSVSGGVITVSALAQPVTEYVTAQPMRTAEGTNTVVVTSEVAPVELSVEYMAGG